MISFLRKLEGKTMAKIIIFTGAGISAESGISTFGERSGIWEKHRIEDVCVSGCLEKNREKVLNFYDTRRLELKEKEVNKAHKVIASLQNKYPKDIKIITQNVDNLFERAGCKDVIHLHGNLLSLRCESCYHVIDIGYTVQKRDLICPVCKDNLRPDIVFFEEKAPMYKSLQNNLRDCELFIVIGTSGTVLSVDEIKRGIKYSILNNLEPSTNIKRKKYTRCYYKPATEAIEFIEKDINTFIRAGSIEREKSFYRRPEKRLHKDENI